ncbi:hypothetical protein LguiA_029065 [Lonicera macranthoides]
MRSNAVYTALDAIFLPSMPFLSTLHIFFVLTIMSFILIHDCLSSCKGERITWSGDTLDKYVHGPPDAVGAPGLTRVPEGTTISIRAEVDPWTCEAVPVASKKCKLGGRLGFINVNYARAGEVDGDPLMNVMVVEILGYIKASDVDDNYDDNEVEEVQVMTIWILEDYHK